MDAPIDKDLPLKEDTRLLGRVLGDVLRAQTGEGAFARIEAIRQMAIRFRRARPDEAPALRTELEALLNPLPIADALHVVRAFSYFSHLANIAEDVHQNRRRRAHALAGSPPQRGSIAHALERLAAAGVDREVVVQWFDNALIAPVLTAHPTEVQRKSIRESERGRGNAFVRDTRPSRRGLRPLSCGSAWAGWRAVALFASDRADGGAADAVRKSARRESAS